MNHEEIVKLKQARIGVVARGMLDGSVHYLIGAMELTALRHEVGAYANDVDFMPFIAILSEIESLPVDLAQSEGLKQAMLAHGTEIQESVNWAKEFSLVQCQSLADRYGSCKE
ncbi:MAG: DUF2489 domain-containing protein [Gammaproteobacteria bacterium]|nr:MAG: DUF2489 domain-containing protein [Gammaproteobacteria bacterium]